MQNRRTHGSTAPASWWADPGKISLDFPFLFFYFEKLQNLKFKVF
jgi:hypothetical protein